MNYNEDTILQEAYDHIKATYGMHYVGTTDVQLTDLWESEGTLSTIAVGNAQKYLSRYGKKEGKNKKDLLKAIHYIVLAMHADFHTDQVVDESEIVDLDTSSEGSSVISMDNLREMILKQMRDQPQ